jgi:hypothetical protein
MLWVVLAMALSLGTVRAQSFLTVPINLSDTGHAVIPSIAVGPSGDINVVWLDSGAILFRHSPAGGGAFSSTLTVATTDLPAQGSQPQVAVNSAGVYVAWAGTNSGGGGDIFFSSLATGGSAFTAPVNVSNTKGIASGSSAPVPRIAVDPSGGVDIVWGQSAAYFARSTDQGKSFATVTPLSASPMQRVSPRITIGAQGSIDIVWVKADPNFPNCSGPTIEFARSTNGGLTFGFYSVLDNLTVNQQPVTGCTSDVQIAAGANNTIHLLWANENTQIRDVIVTYATDDDTSFPPSGSTFPETKATFFNISNTASYTPQMSIDSAGDVNVVWVGDVTLNVPQEVMYFSRSTDGGKTFTNQSPLTSAPAAGAVATGFPQIATEPSGAIDVIWQQASSANPDNAYDIVLARSTDGVSFKQFTLDNSPTVTANTGQIAVDGNGNAYIVWLGNSGSSADILLNGDSQGLTPPPPVFSLSGVTASISPASAVINVNGTATFSLSVKSTNAVAGSLTFSCGGAPAGVACTFNPNPLNISANGTASATLNVGVSVKPLAAAAGDPGSTPKNMPMVSAWMWAIGAMIFFVMVITGKRSAAGLRLQTSSHWGAQRHSAAAFARPLALILLLAGLATGLASCGGSTNSGGGSGGGGTGGGGSITFPLTVQAQSNSATASLQTISITVP